MPYKTPKKPCVATMRKYCIISLHSRKLPFLILVYIEFTAMHKIKDHNCLKILHKVLYL